MANKSNVSDMTISNGNHFMMMEQKKVKRGVSDREQLMINHFFFRFYNLYINRFKWINLPKEIPYYKMEDILFWSGECLFLFDENAGKDGMYAVMNVNKTGTINIYNTPIERIAYANSGYLREYDRKNSVLLSDKPISYSPVIDTQLYAQTLAKMWMTRDINVYAHRTPVIMAMNKDTAISMENLLKGYDEFVPVIKVRDTFDKNTFDAVNLNPPKIFDDLEKSMRACKAEYLNFIGIEANAIEKKERVQSAEVEGNDGEVESNRRISLDMRKRFCEQVNRVFNLEPPMDVEFNSDLPTAVNGFMSDLDIKDGDEDD